MLGEGIIKGMAETARNFVGSYVSDERLTTVQYPEERVPQKEAARNFPFLVYDGNDWQKGLRCVACQICEKECPPKWTLASLPKRPKPRQRQKRMPMQKPKRPPPPQNRRHLPRPRPPHRPLLRPLPRIRKRFASEALERIAFWNFEAWGLLEFSK